MKKILTNLLLLSILSVSLYAKDNKDKPRTFLDRISPDFKEFKVNKLQKYKLYIDAEKCISSPETKSKSDIRVCEAVLRSKVIALSKTSRSTLKYNSEVSAAQKAHFKKMVEMKKSEQTKKAEAAKKKVIKAIK